jgi:hypothetical protein
VNVFLLSSYFRCGSAGSSSLQVVSGVAVPLVASERFPHGRVVVHVIWIIVELEQESSQAHNESMCSMCSDESRSRAPQYHHPGPQSGALQSSRTPLLQLRTNISILHFTSHSRHHAVSKTGRSTICHPIRQRLKFHLAMTRRNRGAYSEHVMFAIEADADINQSSIRRIR